MSTPQCDRASHCLSVGNPPKPKPGHSRSSSRLTCVLTEFSFRPNPHPDQPVTERITILHTRCFMQPLPTFRLCENRGVSAIRNDRRDGIPLSGLNAWTLQNHQPHKRSVGQRPRLAYQLLPRKPEIAFVKYHSPLFHVSGFLNFCCLPIGLTQRVLRPATSRLCT